MNRKTQLLGIDVGTSGLKAVLLDSAGALVDEAGIPYGTATPSPGAGPSRIPTTGGRHSDWRSEPFGNAVPIPEPWQRSVSPVKCIAWS
jgi:hypothetical protein